jgi:hypothetical protein
LHEIGAIVSAKADDPCARADDARCSIVYAPGVPQDNSTATGASAFVYVDVEPGPASEDGVSLRFKRAQPGEAGAERIVRELPYESESGLAGQWTVRAADDADGTQTGDARLVRVEDSSDGEAWLVVGGTQGLVLENVETGDVVREPYLLLSKTSRV